MPQRLIVSSTSLIKSVTLTLIVTLHVHTQRALTALPGRPHDVTLSGVTPTAAVVEWDSDTVHPRVTHFEMTLVTLDSVNESYDPTSLSEEVVEGDRRTITEIVGSVRSYSLEHLSPNTVYQLYIVSYNSEGVGNASSVVTFTTLSEVMVDPPRLSVHPAEVIIVTLIVIAWICAIVLFLHKWGKIRIVQPREPRYKHQPKNLDTIKVVKRPTDSVIYRNHSQQFSKTMQARETRRIARMNTMPNIKVSDVAPESKQRPIEKRNTMPIIEVPEEQETKRERLKLDKLREEETSPAPSTESDPSSSRV